MSVVSSHIHTAKIALQIAALRAGHLVASIALDECLFALVAIANQSFTSGFLDSVTVAKSRLFVTLALVLFTGIGNVRPLLALTTAGDAAGRGLTMEFKVDVDRKADSLEVTEGTSLDIVNTCRTKVVFLTEAHELVYECIGIWDETKLGFAEGVVAATGTSKLETALSDFGFKICFHAVKTYRVFVFRAASDDLVGSILVIASNTAVGLAVEAGADMIEQ